MLRIISAVFALVVVAAIAVLIAGYATSPTQTRMTVFSVDYNAAQVWTELNKFEDATFKKRDVESVEIIERYGRLVAWRENLTNGGYRIYRTNERIDNRKLVVELTESSYGLTGIWTFELWNHSGGTDIRITEESTLTNSRLRGIRFYFGRDHDLLVWIKYINVGMTERLIRTL